MKNTDLLDYINTPEFTAFLRERMEQEILNCEVNGNFTHNRRFMEKAEQLYTDALVLNVYLHLVKIFETNPKILSLSPQWRQQQDEDGYLITTFKLGVEFKDDDNQICRSTVSYGKVTPDMGNTEIIEKTLAAGESIFIEQWNNLVEYRIYMYEEPYTNKDSLLSSMNEDLDVFLPEVKKWALGRHVRSTAENTVRKPSM